MSNPFELLVGPLLILVCVALMYVFPAPCSSLLAANATLKRLFGVFSAQVYFYWFNYEEDSFRMRALVLTLW